MNLRTKIVVAEDEQELEIELNNAFAHIESEGGEVREVKEIRSERGDYELAMMVLYYKGIYQPTQKSFSAPQEDRVAPVEPGDVVQMEPHRVPFEERPRVDFTNGLL